MATYQSVTAADRIDVRPPLERALASLRAATVLRDAGLAADAATRAHQACVHAERALLATEKRSPQDVRGVHRMATLHFLQTDEIPGGHLAAIERLAVLRSRADEVPSGAVSAEEAAEAVDLASSFVAAATTWLGVHGFLADATADGATDGAVKEAAR